MRTHLNSIILSVAPVAIVAVVGTSLVFSACSSGPPVKTQAYATVRNTRTFEDDLPVVWKGTFGALKNTKVTDKDPDDADELQLKKTTKASIETDWIYSQSRDKYVEYKVNGTPRRKQLQGRYKFRIKLKQVIGGTNVEVQTSEEIERLGEDGTSQGYSSVGEPDPSRAGELLDRIGQSILSAAP